VGEDFFDRARARLKLEVPPALTDPNAEGARGADIPYLDPDHRRALGRAVRVPGDLQPPAAGEEYHPGIVGGSNSR